MTELADQTELGGVVVVLVGVVAHHTRVLALGDVHGDVGPLQQIVDVIAVFGGDDEADAGVDRQGQPAHLDLAVDDVAQTPERFLGIRDRREDHAEFVAAETGDGVLGPGVDVEAAGQLGQEPVAVVVAEGVVDVLEPVEVDDGDGHRLVVAGSFEGRRRPPVEQGAVGEVGEVVVLGEEGVERHFLAETSAHRNGDDGQGQIQRAEGDGQLPLLAVESGVVRYYRNNTLIYTSLVRPTYPLLLDTSINSLYGRVSNAYICGANLSR